MPTTNALNKPVHRRSRVLLLCILAVALVLGMIKIHAWPLTLDNGKSNNYWPIVESLLDRGEYSSCIPLYFPNCANTNGLTAMREPVPVLLFAGAAWLGGRSLMMFAYLELAFHMIIILLLYVLVRRWKDERTSLLAALGWALWLPAYQLVPQLSGDLISAVFMLLAALALQRARADARPFHWAMVGALLGLAVLCRSVMLVAFLPFAWWSFRERIRAGSRSVAALAPVVVMGLAMGAVLLPWALRNRAAVGRAYIGTSMNGYNLFRNSSIINDEPYLRYVGTPEAERMTQALLQRRTDIRGDETESEMDAIYMEEGLRALKAHPVRYAILSLYRFIPLWTNIGVKEEYGLTISWRDKAIIVEQLLLLPLFLLGWRKAGREAMPWIMTVALVVLAYMAVVAQVRYIASVMPFVIAVSAWGLASLLDRTRATA